MTNNTSPIKVLHAVGGLNRGGIETWLLQMVRTIDRSRVAIDVLIDSDAPQAYTEDFRRAGCKILPCLNAHRPWLYAINFTRIYNEHGPYDIVHSHVHYFSGVVLTLARFCRVPVRIVHSHPVGDLKPASIWRTLYRCVTRQMIRRSATYVLACSETSMAAFVTSNRLQLSDREVVYNAVDVSRFNRPVDRSAVREQLGLPLEIPLVIYVARFFSHKNHRQAIRIADRLNQAGTRVHFVFVGSYGPIQEQVVAEARLRSYITAITDLEDIADVLLSADVFLFPSLEEGFGIVAIEAAAAGLPVIASRLEPIKEACTPSHRAFMFGTNNDDEAIASLKRVLGDEKLRSSLSHDGRKWAEQFSIENSRKSLLSAYRTALGRPDECERGAGDRRVA